MRFCLAIIVLFLCKSLLAQEYISWVDSISTRIILNEIQLYDEDLNPIRNSDVVVMRKDTVTNDQWTRPKFINNVLYGATDGVVLDNILNFDTATSLNHGDFINFTFVAHDDQGNWLGIKTAFTVNRKHLRRAFNYGNSKHFGKLKNSAWENYKVMDNGNEVELDSCLQLYKLVFNDDFSFSQSLGHFTYCSTQSMQPIIRVGLEDNSNDWNKWNDKLQGHYIDMPYGVWQLSNNDLKLIDIKTKNVVTFEIESVNDIELRLSIPKFGYNLLMKRVTQ